MDLRVLLLPIAVLLLALCVILPARPTVRQVMGGLAAVFAGVDLLLRLMDL